jgi:hypothetical protein
LFIVRRGTLILENNITLLGKAGNNAPLVTLDGWNSKLEMNTGAVINGNKGGGVEIVNGSFNMSGGAISNNSNSGVYSYGGLGKFNSFTMSCGTITGNTVSDGGGVYVCTLGGSFTMAGGTISGNTAGGSGGGVYYGINGTGNPFTMRGGTISSNTASNGGGVYAIGTFHMVTGTIYGSGATGDLKNTATSGMGAVFMALEPNMINLILYSLLLSGLPVFVSFCIV